MFTFPHSIENIKVDLGSRILYALKFALPGRLQFFVNLIRPFEEEAVAEICGLVHKEGKGRGPGETPGLWLGGQLLRVPPTKAVLEDAGMGMKDSF